MFVVLFFTGDKYFLKVVFGFLFFEFRVDYLGESLEVVFFLSRKIMGSREVVLNFNIYIY